MQRRDYMNQHDAKTRLHDAQKKDGIEKQRTDDASEMIMGPRESDLAVAHFITLYC